MKKEKKKILIISNNALSKSNSNGRTLLNLLKSISKDNLAQFYISGNPDKEVCSNYFKMSDRNALNCFLHIKKVNNLLSLNNKEYLEKEKKT